MIKLTNHFKSKKPVWINSTMIQSIELFTGTRPDETYTNVMAISGATYNVVETPERIVEMIGEKKSILQERMYSEKEVMEIAKQYAKRCQATIQDMKWLIEQFKKK